MNYKIILSITLFIFFFGALSFFGTNYFLEKEKNAWLEIQIGSQSTLEEVVSGRVLYIIDKGEGALSQYQIVIADDSTVFSLLEELAERENFEIETTLYPEMGVFVESINGLKGGKDNKWWLYWVNDKLGEVAADKKEVKEGDKVEWKFVVPAF